MRIYRADKTKLELLREQIAKLEAEKEYWEVKYETLKKLIDNE